MHLWVPDSRSGISLPVAMNSFLSLPSNGTEATLFLKVKELFCLEKIDPSLKRWQ